MPGDITRAGNAWEASTSGITAGKTGTVEGFGEINLPLLRDLPLIQSLTLTGAARITNVKATRASDGATDSTNGNWTYKLGADWELTDWLRLRGTYGTSFRAPALFEQFLANEKSALSQRSVDPCIQWGINLDEGNISQRMADNCAADGVPGEPPRPRHRRQYLHRRRLRPARARNLEGVDRERDPHAEVRLPAPHPGSASRSTTSTSR